MKLFAIYVGGQLSGANIELHDMRFIAAASLEDTYDDLRRQWWGASGSLHIDCWAELDHVDGFDVTLASEPFGGPERLFYVNLGGYDPAQFTEIHRNTFVVASSVAQAKARALSSVKAWEAPHRDDLYEADQAFALEKTARENRLYIHLTPNSSAGPPRFTCAYTPIRAYGKPAGSC